MDHLRRGAGEPDVNLWTAGGRNSVLGSRPGAIRTAESQHQHDHTYLSQNQPPLADRVNARSSGRTRFTTGLRGQEAFWDRVYAYRIERRRTTRARIRRIESDRITTESGREPLPSRAAVATSPSEETILSLRGRLMPFARQADEHGAIATENSLPGDAASRPDGRTEAAALPEADATATPASHYECVICEDPISEEDELVSLPCKNVWCRDCLNDAFRAALSPDATTTGSFPPRCCDEISFEAVRHRLDPELAAEYQRKYLELRTPVRLYCHAPSCNAFLGPLVKAAIAVVCPRCWRQTCGSCRSASHPGNCVMDNDTAQFHRAANDNGWSKCYQCGGVVELTEGCTHIRCPCGAEFCYVCCRKYTECCCHDARLAQPLQRPQLAVSNTHPQAQHLRGLHMRVQRARTHLPTLNATFQAQFARRLNNAEAQLMAHVGDASRVQATSQERAVDFSARPNHSSSQDAQHLQVPHSHQQSASMLANSTHVDDLREAAHMLYAVRPPIRSVSPEPDGGLGSQNRTPLQQSQPQFIADEYMNFAHGGMIDPDDDIFQYLDIPDDDEDHDRAPDSLADTSEATQD